MQYHQRTDFIWKSITVYFILLILYTILISSVNNFQITFLISDPILILICLIITIAICAALYRTFFNKRIIIENDSISFSNRLGTKNYHINCIEKIQIKKRNIPAYKQDMVKFYIYIKDRSKPIRIRPASYGETETMIQDIRALKINLELN